MKESGQALDLTDTGVRTGNAIANVYIEAALAVGLDVEILSERTGVAVVSGRNRELLIHGRWVGINDLTPTMMCSDKHYSARVLKDNGLPVPDSVVACCSGHWRREHSARIVMDAARDRYPVCIKPVSGTHGFQVIPDIRDEEELLRVLHANPAAGCSDTLIESHCEGRHYRVIVAFGEVIGCVERKAPTVVGDGGSTLGGLVEEYNRDRRAWGVEECVLGYRQMYVTRRRYGLDRDDVAPEGAAMTIDDRCNLKIGGTIHHVDVAEMSDAVKSMCVSAAGAFDLDFAGLDLIGDDIRGRESGEWMINEVNTQPAAPVPVPTMTRSQRLVWPTRLLQSYFSC